MTVYVCITVIDYCDWLYVVLYQHAIKQENIARFLITKTQVPGSESSYEAFAPLHTWNFRSRERKCMGTKSPGTPYRRVQGAARCRIGDVIGNRTLSELNMGSYALATPTDFSI